MTPEEEERYYDPGKPRAPWVPFLLIATVGFWVGVIVGVVMS